MYAEENTRFASGVSDDEVDGGAYFIHPVCRILEKVSSAYATDEGISRSCDQRAGVWVEWVGDDEVEAFFLHAVKPPSRVCCELHAVNFDRLFRHVVFSLAWGL